MSKQESLRDEELDRLSAICVLKDHYGAFVYANKLTAERFDEPTGGFVGKTDYHVMSDPDASVVRRNDKDVLTSGERLQTVEYVSAGGHRAGYFVTKWVVLCNKQRFLAVIGVPIEVADEDAEVSAARDWVAQNFDYIERRLTDLAFRLSGGVPQKLLSE